MFNGMLIAEASCDKMSDACERLRIDLFFPPLSATMKFSIGSFSSKKKQEPKRTLEETSEGESASKDTSKRMRSTVIQADDEDDFLASAGIGIDSLVYDLVEIVH